ncbi:hypothetical protein [Clostridium kluyveri]|uniref:hypothetical protein n=1 Tax=Clostridium kluyveri TaxID=1534 RepID=UPI00224704DF|nr:hypothetical protein [Clostridium kluyveri]UZQ50325.1 hypothetical protein OP486_20710 [Clostridium kluyveri]
MFNKLRIQEKKGIEITTQNLHLNIDLRLEVAFPEVVFPEVASPEVVFLLEVVFLEVEVHELE